MKNTKRKNLDSGSAAKHRRESVDSGRGSPETVKDARTTKLTKTQLGAAELRLQALPIENLVFSGGGAKGAMYIGALQSLQEADLVSNIQIIAGTSAGAITSALLATGAKAEKISQIMEEVDFDALLGDTSNRLMRFANRSGNELLQFISHAVKNNIAEYIQNHENLQQALDPGQIEILGSIMRRCHDPLADITFADLAFLRAVDHTTFKDLKMIATEQDTGEVAIFSADTTPDVSIADACRASASLPIILKAHEINGKHYIDGGLIDNLPVQAIEVSSSSHPVQTLIFAFQEGSRDKGEIHRTMHSLDDPYEPNQSIGGKVQDYVISAPKLQWGIGGGFISPLINKDENHADKLRHLQSLYPLRIIQLTTGSIGALDTKAAKKNEKFLALKGYFETMDYVLHHELAKNLDQLIVYQECKFILNFYESMMQMQSQQWIGRLRNDEKQNSTILDFADSAKMLSYNAIKNGLAEFIISTTVDYRTEELLKNNIILLLEHLNSDDIPKDVKMNLGMAIGIDPKHSLSSRFKFDQHHIEDFISNNLDKVARFSENMKLQEKSSSSSRSL